MEIENKKLKLNFKNTFLIGMAFFSITLLWTVYGQYCPLMVEQVLRNMDPVTFPDHDSTLLPVGIIMALDNALALFMLPLFGTLSDKTKCKFGKRMIYVFPGICVCDIHSGMQYSHSDQMRRQAIASAYRHCKRPLPCPQIEIPPLHTPKKEQFLHFRQGK